MLWMGSVLIAAAMGWAAAMYVQAGARSTGPRMPIFVSAMHSALPTLSSARRLSLD